MRINWAGISAVALARGAAPFVRTLIAVALAVVCAGPVAGGEPEVRYQDLPANFPHKMTGAQLDAAIVNNDVATQRAHAWGLWSALTTTSRSHYHGQPLAVWQTWFSDRATFSEDAATAHPTLLDACCTFEEPLQAKVAHAAFGGKATQVLAFVRFNDAAHEYIVHNAYNRKATLDRIVASYDKNGQPVQLRALPLFPREAVAIKSTFWLIKNPHGKTGVAALTPLPYWDPAYPPPGDGRTPNHLTWRKCVAVDPGHNFVDGATVRIPCNGQIVRANVVHMDRFASLYLSDPHDVGVARTFAKHISMDTDQEHVVTSQYTPDVGDRLIVTAMHVMTREIDRWTFQTFWWTPVPNAAPFGNDRPATVLGHWRNYDMCNAYNEDLPRTAGGGPHVCFDPYLETDLGPTKPYVLGGVKYGADPMAGTRSNCMACHSRAAWPAKLSPPYTSAANLGRIFNPGYIAPNAPYYKHVVTTDMLWSIPLQAQP